MFTPPKTILHDSDVLPALRDLVRHHPTFTQSGPETLSRALYVFRYLSHYPEPFVVEAAREALLVEGELLP